MGQSPSSPCFGGRGRSWGCLSILGPPEDHSWTAWRTPTPGHPPPAQGPQEGVWQSANPPSSPASHGPASPSDVAPCTLPPDRNTLTLTAAFLWASQVSLGSQIDLQKKKRRAPAPPPPQPPPPSPLVPPRTQDQEENRKSATGECVRMRPSLVLRGVLVSAALNPCSRLAHEGINWGNIYAEERKSGNKHL